MVSTSKIEELANLVVHSGRFCQKNLSYKTVENADNWFFHQISQFVQPNWLDYKSDDLGGENKVLNAKIETFLSILMGKKFIFSLENETFLLMKI